MNGIIFRSAIVMRRRVIPEEFWTLATLQGWMACSPWSSKKELVGTGIIQLQKAILDSSNSSGKIGDNQIGGRKLSWWQFMVK